VRRGEERRGDEERRGEVRSGEVRRISEEDRREGEKGRIEEVEV
jgi:hypothetical protein